jgi:hypothetical protein
MTVGFTDHASLSPSEALFLWTDLDRVHEWRHGLTRVTDVVVPDGYAPMRAGGWPLVIGPGSQYTLWFGRSAVHHEVLAPAHRGVATHHTRVAGRFHHGDVLVTFAPESGGSRVTLEFRPDGLLPAATARLMATGGHRWGFRGQLRAFARLAERERLGHLVL